MGKKLKKPAIRFKGFTDDWEQRKLKEIADKVSEKNKNNEFSEPFTNSAEQGIISQKDYFDREIVNNENLDSYYIVRNDDFIYNPRISVMAPVGPINRNRLGRNGVMSPLYTVFRTHDIDNLYLEFYFKTTKWHRFMKLNGDSGARFDRFTISSTQFMEMPIPYPMLDEQRKIGEYFDSLDNLITLHQRKYEKLLNVKKSMLEKMFPQNGSKVPEIRFFGFADDWEQRKVSELFKVTRGYVLAATLTQPAKTDEMPYPVYSSQTKDNGLMGYYKDYLYEDAITWTTDGANAGTVNYRAGKFYCTNVCGVLLSNEVTANQMIAEALNNVAKGYVSYVGNPKLMNNVMADIEIMIPTHAEERERLSVFFRNLDHLITLHQRKFQNIFQIMLQFGNSVSWGI